MFRIKEGEVITNYNLDYYTVVGDYLVRNFDAKIMAVIR